MKMKDMIFQIFFEEEINKVADFAQELLKEERMEISHKMAQLVVDQDDDEDNDYYQKEIKKLKGKYNEITKLIESLNSFNTAMDIDMDAIKEKLNFFRWKQLSNFVDKDLFDECDCS